MSVLPIIARELRVRARKPWTAWTRVVVALLVSLIAASTLSWANLQTMRGGLWQPGRQLFDTLSALILLFCLVEGVRQTADSISQEKREGTLGLLLLTDLTGLDIVLGKLAATSLGSFYMLLAAFPAMSIALPAGGLAAGEFWRTQLVLINTLFLAVATGLWSSARHREESRALLKGLGLVALLTIAPWLLEWPLRRMGLPNVSPWVSLVLGNDANYAAQPLRFWLTLAAVHALGWMLLVRAGRRVANDWRDEPPLRAAKPGVKPPVLATFVVALHRRTKSRRLLEADPAGWLAARLSAHPVIVRTSVALLALGPLLPRLLIQLSPAGPMGGLYTAIHLGTQFVPLLLLAFVAARMFAEARRDGAMELLLSTPLAPRDIVRAHWRALWKQATGPFLIVLLVLVMLAFLASFASLTARAGFGATELLLSQLMQFLPCADRLLRGGAALWLGLYLGLRMRTTMQAIGYNLLWTLVVPMVGTYLLWLPIPLLFGGRWAFGAPLPFYLVQLFHTLASFAYSAWLIRWARRRLEERFREFAAA